ncbi:ATP synthase subunit b [bacterium HR08]|nr:ATP synthase subunit b [bacterium HR08]
MNGPLGLVGSGLPRVVNFLIFVAALYYLLRKPASDFFRQRARAIARELEEARRAREAAARELEQARARAARVDEEVAALRARAEQEAEAEYERLWREAHAEAEKIRALAEREIEMARRAAEMELKAFLVERALARARAVLRQQLTEEDHRRLIAQFIEELAEVPR